MDDFVSKPFDVETIAIALARWVTAPAVPSVTVPSGEDVGAASDGSPIDPERVAALVDLGSVGDSTLLAVLADRFLGNGRRILANIREAGRIGSDEDLRKAAHELNGSSSNVGATRVSALCRELEAGVGRADPERTDLLLEQLEAELALANDALVQAVLEAS